MLVTVVEEPFCVRVVVPLPHGRLLVTEISPGEGCETVVVAVPDLSVVV